MGYIFRWGQTELDLSMANPSNQNLFFPNGWLKWGSRTFKLSRPEPTNTAPDTPDTTRSTERTGVQVALYFGRSF